MKYFLGLVVAGVLSVTVLLLPTRVQADHAWDEYHWARTSNPFTLKVGDNLSSAWDPYLQTTISDWSTSTVLDLVAVAGNTMPKRCKPSMGQIEVCNSTYGKNGWLGIAQIWASGNHIVQAATKLNDTYFNTAKYNLPAWKNLVMCQEVGHTFGLDHQDENFSNPNLGSCMDYTNDPSSNQHPNQHDYEELESIYAHLDSTTTSSATPGTMPADIAQGTFDNRSEWGKQLKDNGRVALFERDFGHQRRIFTFVIWAQD
jgi:hypothetical protein